MGKRSNFKRFDRDAYFTWDQRAYPPLLHHLPGGVRFVEPCAGRGDLIDALQSNGHRCEVATDIQPMDGRIFRSDILTATPEDIRATGADMVITNPPWRRDLLHPMIKLFSDALPTWLLFDSDWINTKQAAPFEDRLRKVQVVGRLRWIEGSACDGMKDCSWYLFDRPSSAMTVYHMRVV